MRSNILKARIFKDENGNTKYERPCKRCRKFFVSDKPQRVYCSDACKEAYNKSKKSKSRSGKRYVRKHNVSRAVEASGRTLSRRLATLCLKPIDYITGEEFTSWDFVQIHHLDLCPLNCEISNLIPLTPQSHAFLHDEIRKKFGKGIDDKVYLFGRGIYNFSSKEEYEEIQKLKDEIVKFERSLFKVEFGQEIPQFKEK